MTIYLQYSHETKGKGIACDMDNNTMMPIYLIPEAKVKE